MSALRDRIEDGVFAAVALSVPLLLAFFAPTVPGPLEQHARQVSAQVSAFKSQDSVETPWSDTRTAPRFAAEDQAEPAPDQSETMTTINTFQRGRLLHKNGLPVLVLRGSYFDMGLQYGFLAGEHIASMLALFDTLATRESSGLLSSGAQQGLRRWLGDVFARHFPTSARFMLEGVREGAALKGIPLDLSDLFFLNSLIDIAGIGSTDLSFSADGIGAMSAFVGLVRREIGTSWLRQNCNTFAAWGSRTQGGKTFQTRNTDITVGLGLERFPLAYVAFPESAGTPLVPYVSAGFAGQIGVSTGMNAHGVALGQVWAFSRVKSIGVPWSLLMIDIMSRASTASEAADMMLQPRPSPHTYGNNFVFADGKGDAWAVELNPLRSDRFRAADPREVLEARMADGHVWAVPLRDAVVRADFSMSRKIRKDQTSAGGPLGYPPMASSYRDRYAGQIKRILAFEQLGRPIGVREAMMISRATADRKSGNMQLAVYANSDKRLWVSYAKSENGTIKQAYENPFVLIPFDRLLQEPEMPSAQD